MNHTKVKFLSILLAILMVVPMIVPALTFEAKAATEESYDSWYNGAATSFAGGSGTQADPYQIANAAQLAYLAKLINYDQKVLPDSLANYNAWSKYSKAYYVLTADIDLGNREWVPIGGTSYPSVTHYYDASGNPVEQASATTTKSINYRFQGRFDGQGHTISNMTITKEQPVGTGLFGFVNNATIKNFTLMGKVSGYPSDKTTAENQVPSISVLCIASYGSTIDGVNVHANINVKQSKNFGSIMISALCGYVNGGTIKNCNLDGTIETKISTSSLSIGSIAGKTRNNTTFQNVKSDIDIYARDLTNSNHYIGGLIGYCYSNSTVTATVSAEDTTPTASNKPESAYFSGCVYSGDIHANTAKGTLYIGGIAGQFGLAAQNDHTQGGMVEVANCFYDGDIYANSEVAGAIYKGSVAGRNLATQLTIRNFITSSTEEKYKLDTDRFTYISADEKGDDYNYHLSPLVVDNQGGHMENVTIDQPYGVALRLTYGSTGLRFNSTIKTALYDELAAREDVTFTLGTIIAPTDYVEAAGEFTVSALEALQEKYSLSDAYLNVVFDPEENSWLDQYYSDNTVHYFSGAISGIKTENYNRLFSGVGYVTIECEGVSHTFFGDYVESARSRAATYVAKRVNEDRSDTKVNEYQFITPEGNYSPYSQQNLNSIADYVAAYDETLVGTADLKLIENGTSKYAIVYPHGASEAERTMAAYLQHVIYGLTGVELALREAVPSVKATKNEIVIGCFERAGAYFFNSKNFDGEYMVTVSGKRVLILGDNDQALCNAVAAFVKQCFNVNLATATKLTKTANANVSVPRFLKLLGTDASTAVSNTLADYTIHYDYVNEIQKRMAYLLQQDYLAITGTTLPMTIDSESDLSGKYIRFGGDANLTDGQWRINNSSGLIGISAGSYYGFQGALEYLAAEIKYGMAPINTSGFTATGKYQAWMDGYAEATQYAYDKQGTARVMHYNVLWGESNTVTKSDGSKVEYTYPLANRNALRLEMVKQYLPDVLGLQEVNKVVRGNADDGKGGFIANLEDIGYAEAFDPRVNNAYLTTETIPGSDASLTTPNATPGTLLNGYASSTDSSITNVGATVNGEYVNYTFMNCTPIFYNTATTTCVDAGYYWYKSQTDLFYRPDTKEEPSYVDGYHQNGSSDAASKSASWGVFETDGDRYIVVTTHMCTRSNYIRGLQARELVALINELVAEYNAPVMLGGDFNGNHDDNNYKYFTGPEANYTDLPGDEVAEIFNSDVISNHGSPDEVLVYTNENASLLDKLQGKNKYYLVVGNAGDAKDGTKYSSDSIDRIYTTNDSKLIVDVYGVVVDECTLAGSDHYPVFADVHFSEFKDYSKDY